MTADGSKIILLQWDLDEYTDRTATDFGMLELSLHSFYLATDTQRHEFDKLRLVEILGGDPRWTRDEVTLQNFTKNVNINSALNLQMIIDVKIPSNSSPPQYIHIPRPVIQRLLEGRTRGIAIYPLGPMSDSFYPGQTMHDPVSPRLYFNMNSK